MTENCKITSVVLLPNASNDESNSITHKSVQLEQSINQSNDQTIKQLKPVKTILTMAYRTMALLSLVCWVLYYPVMLSHFLHSLGNYTRGAIFPEMCKINQSSADCHCRSLWSLWLDWFVGFVPPDLFLRRGGGAKVTQHNGIKQYYMHAILICRRWPQWRLRT